MEIQHNHIQHNSHEIGMMNILRKRSSNGHQLLLEMSSYTSLCLLLVPVLQRTNGVSAQSVCEDSPLDVAGTNGLGCAEIAEDHEFCDVEEYLSHCRKTCDSCFEYACSDSDLLWTILGGDYTSALSAGTPQENIDLFCDSYSELSGDCRLTCKFCP